MEIIFSDEKKVSFNVTQNTIHYIPKEDPSRDGSQWILDSIRRRTHEEHDDVINQHVATCHSSTTSHITPTPR